MTRPGRTHVSHMYYEEETQPTVELGNVGRQKSFEMETSTFHLKTKQIMVSSVVWRVSEW